MRWQDIFENSQNSYFDPSAVYLHGGVAELRNNRFERTSNDAGGLFFAKENEIGYKYALAYAIKASIKRVRTGIWRVKINLSQENVFELTNPKHLELAQNNLSEEEFNLWTKVTESNHLHWKLLNEHLLKSWGFKGAVLFEKGSDVGFGIKGTVLSVVVFDPENVHIIDFIPKNEALQKWGR